MKKLRRRLLCIVTVTVLLFRPVSFGADTSMTYLNISGTVPVVFSVTARGYPGDLDLSPNVVVNNRLIGLLHFKYNVNIANLYFASNTASGGPEGPNGTYDFQGGFFVSIGAGCATVDAAYNAPFVLTAAGTDIKSPLSAALINGIEEDCEVNASWQGTANTLPLAGIYSMNITVTMVSQ